MNISDYVFNIGDEVITVDGETGMIFDICECEECKRRGFCEPIWENDKEDYMWITNSEAECGFTNYHRIGKYRFNPVRREAVEIEIAHLEGNLKDLRKRLALIETLEKED